MRVLFFLILVGLIVPSFAFGAIHDDFDGWSPGQDLNGVGYWATTSNSTGDVSASQYVSSPHSAYFSSSASNGWFYATSTEYTGSVSFDLFVSTCPTGTSASFMLYSLGSFVMNYLVLPDPTGGCLINHPGSGSFAPLATSTWYDVEIEWSGATNLVTFYLDGVLATSTPPDASLGSGVDEFVLVTDSAFYLDNLYFTPGSISYCSQFEYEGSCESAGCTWWFSQEFFDGGLYPYQGCVDTATVPPEYQDVLDPYPDQATCEGAGYYWVPGSGCYATSTDFQVDMNLFDRFWDIVKDPSGFFDTLFDAFDFRKKPPFSWAIEIYGIITSSLADSGSYTSDLSAFSTTTVVTAGLGTLQFKFIDFRWVQNEYSSYFGTFRSIIGFILWLSFASFVVVRSRRFAEMLSD